MIILTKGIKDVYNIVEKTEKAYEMNKNLLIECSDEYKLKSVLELLSYLNNEERKVFWADGGKISNYSFILGELKDYHDDFGYALCSLSLEVNDFPGGQVWLLKYNIGRKPFWFYATHSVKENLLRYII